MTADLAIFPPLVVERRSAAVGARHLHPAALPRWRVLLGIRWQERLELVTAFSLAYHDAREAADDASSGPDARCAARRRASAALHRAVAERLALAEIEAALARLAAGRFGWCEQCAAAIAAARLAEIPHARCCPECERYPSFATGHHLARLAVGEVSPAVRINAVLNDTPPERAEPLGAAWRSST
jgi:RNA polymerase-binding transcription factor DksA